ncbi:hypothetical protein RvY_00275 [Ramazzottius varieornatus]|uniref:Uncharacterized protein n=1 Tax=Ramazzottius varieornatus TaxID=947166 RepID=A0A1D1UJM0_RAMVA|nr:hypothetical protein RvY_00275 [Ramazzottius varieornatus]
MKLAYENRYSFLIGMLLAFLLKNATQTDGYYARYAFALDVQQCSFGFCICHSVSSTQLTKLRKSISNGSFEVPVHSLKGRKGHGAMKAEKCGWVVDFLMENGNLYGLPMPTPTRTAIQLPPIYLPSDFTFTSLYDGFCKRLRKWENEELVEAS